MAHHRAGQRWPARFAARRLAMTARARRFAQVDVFCTAGLSGNPVAVVLDGDGLDSAAMQAFAAWTNLSETTFVLPPTDPAADYRLRIFTPRAELPFAGHPTLGSAHAVLTAGIADAHHGRLVQQCAAGMIELAVDGADLSLTMPPAAITAAPQPDRLAAALPVALVGDTAVVDVGPRWVIAQAADAAALAAMTPDLAALAAYDRVNRTTGLTIFAGTGDGGDIVVRSFAPADGIAEDPVCGSGNGAVAAFRLSSGALTVGDAYIAHQGAAVGRAGRVAVRVGADAIHIGGRCATIITGTVHL